MTFWIDAHCHMNEECYRENFDEYMARAKENNVQISNVVCLNKEDYLYSCQLKERYPQLDISFGYFPEDLHHDNAQDMAYLESVADSLMCIGEIGLDYYYSREHKAQQQEMFIRQIRLANKAGKPIMIHSRSAAQDTYDILKEYAKTPVMMHCFSESHEMMQRYLKLGYYISIGGVVTFKNAQSVKLNAQTCPLDNLLTETDCPYLTPVPLRGRQNETAYVHYTGEYIAQLRGISEAELQQAVMNNYFRYRGY